MTYRDWEQRVPRSITDDPLRTVRVYRLALFAYDLCWHDLQRVKAERLYSLVDQLSRACGGISAQIAECYSRRTGKDRAHFYEYALGSARESRDWYFKARHILGQEVACHRMDLHAHTIRLLMTMVPDQRRDGVREEYVTYGADSLDVFLEAEIPFCPGSGPRGQA